MRNFFKAIVTFFVCVCCYCSFSPAFADSPPTFNKLVFFGDSLSDNGNLYSIDFKYMPKSPPYYQGRFSNGQVWSEKTAQYFAAKNAMEFVDYAYGGETAIFHNPMKGFMPYSLTFSIDSYLLHTILHDRSQSLYFIWIGANDYLNGADDPDDLTTKVVANIKASIEKLAYHGGANFVVVNLPDLGRTPYGAISNAALLSQLTNLHNAKLAAAVTEIQQDYPNVNIHLFDINKIFTDFLDNTNSFDKRNHLHVTDVKNACWQGNYTLRLTAQARESVTDQIAADIQQHINNNPQKLTAVAEEQQPNLDVQGFASYIANTPALLETYKVSSGEMQPCSNPDQYMFWDHLHPTTVVHTAVSNLMIDFINQNYHPA